LVTYLVAEIQCDEKQTFIPWTMQLIILVFYYVNIDAYKGLGVLVDKPLIFHELTTKIKAKANWILGV